MRLHWVHWLVLHVALEGHCYTRMNAKDHLFVDALEATFIDCCKVCKALMLVLTQTA